MLLHEALLQTECPICLQHLNYVVPPPPSRSASPLYCDSTNSKNNITGYAGLTSSSPTAGGHASSTTHSPVSLPNGPLDSDGDDEFHITFASGVYGSDAVDPWRSSFETLPENDAGLQGHTTAAPSNSRLSSSSSPAVAFPSPTSLLQEGHSAQGGCNENVQGSGARNFDESASGVAVLPCGHLLHYLCAVQLCEYATHPSCPVCRMKLNSAVDLVLFRPRARAPACMAASQLVSSTSFDEEARKKEIVLAAARKRRREEAKEAKEGQGRRADFSSDDGFDGEGSNSVTIVADIVPSRSENSREAKMVLGGTELTNIDVSNRATVASAICEHGTVSSPPVSIGPLSGAIDNTKLSLHSVTGQQEQALSSPPFSPPPSTLRDENVIKKFQSSEDDILIVGSRQLPPSQAYAELLLRTTATWVDRTDVLKTRVAHLQRSQQQLQRDCIELDRTLNAARRRRELLLNVPSSSSSSAVVPSAAAAPLSARSGDNPEAFLPSFERLRELRRLCEETHTAVEEATAQLAASARAHAEVRRQIEKYSRKLARLTAGEVSEEAEINGRVDVKKNGTEHLSLHHRNRAGGGGSGADRGASEQGRSRLAPQET